MHAYRLLAEDARSAFRREVTAARPRGWSLRGPAVCAFDAARGVMRCGQAVVKEGETNYDASMKLGAL